MLGSRWLHPRPPYVGFAYRLVATSDGCTVRGTWVYADNKAPPP
ncbi:hypothetical protein BDZ31_004582 [Conexibacter arvalis]|uniref:Uncharacterized protein n=1 Tax=Conexibacter arvalis TaxID=912552 RepID=A0A840ILE5_9ACTN|nr:hypothetical protein [Conexibacter arvalis]